MSLRQFVILLLSAAIIVVGALLPNLAGQRQDAASDGEIFFATINDVELEFAESDITLRDTIAILCGSREDVEIPEELTSRSRDEVIGIANVAAEAYRDACIAFQSHDGVQYGFEILICKPVLAYSSGDENKSNIFWQVNLCGKDRAQVMNFTIDDRTGTICSMEYSDGNAEYTKQEMKSILYTFSSVYLAELGEEFYDFDSDSILAAAKSPLDNSYLASEISWFSSEYEYRTTFLVNTHGFYTYLAPVAY